MLHYFFRVLTLSLFLTQGAHAMDTAPRLSEITSFEHYDLYKITTNDVFPGRGWNKADTQMTVDMKKVLESELIIPEPVRKYFLGLENFKEKKLIFENVVNNENYFSKIWTDKNHIITIEDYEKIRSASDINEYLGPLALIPNHWYGIATFHLKWNEEVLKFKSAAIKDIWSFKSSYWGYIKLYLPPKEYGTEVKSLLLVASDPVNELKDNGLYILIPKSEEKKCYPF